MQESNFSICKPKYLFGTLKNKFNLPPPPLYGYLNGYHNPQVKTSALAKTKTFKHFQEILKHFKSITRKAFKTSFLKFWYFQIIMIKQYNNLYSIIEK